MCKLHLAENVLLANQDNYIENNSMACLDTMKTIIRVIKVNKSEVYNLDVRTDVEALELAEPLLSLKH
ncbi:hypothetical protein DUI87_07346 [Hirundo rustica rustica]|uniref:Uncharacterized protein n=1 Tax=Hirundo rustica rustica TaxID=333673 RepID=A0A3M0KUT6_HIRRU|nr:hypothetical protein DUI87_07346 [Hirundo rustica rustica]